MEPIKKLIKQTTTQIEKERDKFALTLGITGVQMTVLDFIANQENDQVSQHEIEKEFGLQRSTVTVMVQRMEKRDLIERISSKTDKRQKLVSLTQKGKSLIPRIKDYVKDDDQKLRAHFSDADLQTLIEILNYVKNGGNNASN